MGKIGFGMAMWLLGSVVVLLSSCEKDALGGAGEAMEVHFTLNNNAYGEGEAGVARSAKEGEAGVARSAKEGEEEIARSAKEGAEGIARSEKKTVSETVTTRLEGGFCMHATLKEADESLRAAPTLAAGTLLRVVVFQGTTDTYSAEYKVAANGTDIVPVSPPGLSVPTEVAYTFVVYSYNRTDVSPEYSSPVGSITVSPEYDLLWGSKAMTLGTGGSTVEIELRHKFSLVDVEISAAAISGAPDITDISNVSLSPGYTTSLGVQYGGMSRGSVFTQTFSDASDSWNGLDTPTVSHADGLLVYTYGYNVSVKIGSITIDALTYTTIPDIAFAIPFVSGSRYSLTIEFTRNVVWAGSNVYWVETGTNTGYMTFDAPTTWDDPNQRRQGLLFCWGSLIGMTSDSSGTYNRFGYASSFNATTGQKTSGGSSLSISGNNLSTNGRHNTYLSDQNNRDICRYISENGYGPDEGGVKYRYRMPTSYEQGMSTKDYYYGGPEGWLKFGDALSWSEHRFIASGNGDALMDSYVSNPAANLTLPTPGWYNIEVQGNNSQMLGFGAAGCYWSCSEWGSYRACNMECHSSLFSPGFVDDTSVAMSVRCVRNE
jgi:hypothetical protein